MQQRTLTQLYIYPVKSLRGIAVDVMELTDKGPKWDRRWMLTDSSGRFLSLRELPQMAFLQPSLQGGQLQIEDLRGGRPALEVPLALPADAPGTEVVIWNDQCRAVAVSADADRWLSEALDSDCRLVYMPEDSLRPVDPNYAVGEEWVSFADGYPYLIIGEASLADLNSRLEQPIGMERFRPNLVFDGGLAFEEDEWGNFSIGTSHFRAVKACARCQIPTIDLRTGIAAKEPTRTLATYRRRNNNVYFGMNVCWTRDKFTVSQTIRIGDPLLLA